MRPVALATALTAFSSPAGAAPPMRLDFGYATQYVVDRSHDAISDTDVVPGLRLGVGYRFDLGPGEMDVEAAYAGSWAAPAALHGVTQLSLQMHSAEVGARYRRAAGPWWLSWMEPYGRLGATLDWARLRVESPAPGLEQWVARPGLVALAGLEIGALARFADPEQAPQRRRWLVDVSVGWSLRAPFRFDGLRAPKDDKIADPIPEAPVDLGALWISGFTFRVGLVVKIG